MMYHAGAINLYSGATVGRIHLPGTTRVAPFSAVTDNNQPNASANQPNASVVAVKVTRAGNRRFRRLSALHAHANAP
jgi:hypothetical protein